MTAKQSGRLARISSLIIIVAVLAFPVLYHYAPPVSASSGYRMQVVTKPSAVDSIVKMSQVVTEQCPCEYTLLGWSTNNQLYYQATCDEETFWRYNPASSGSEPVLAVPASLVQIGVSENAILEMVRANDARPKENEPAIRHLYLKSQGYVSPNGQWAAAITQHIYGPQDIVVLTPAE